MCFQNLKFKTYIIEKICEKYFFSCNRDTDWRFAATTLSFPRYSAACWKNSCDAIIQHSPYIATTNLLLLTAKHFLISSYFQALMTDLKSCYIFIRWLFFIYLLIVLFFLKYTCHFFINYFQLDFISTMLL